jgi:hypothetical protein
VPGLLQHYDVASDTLEQLELALALLFTWDRMGAKTYRSGETNGFSWLQLSGHKNDDGFQVLPFPLDTKAKMFSFVRDWLSTAKRGPEYDTDGSVSEGWRVTQNDSVWEAEIVRIQADWIIYGK